MSLKEQTLSIVKPDAVAANNIGLILAELEKCDLKIVAMRMHRLTKAEAEEFYAEHSERGHFAELIEFMTSAPVVLQILEGDNAIVRNREIMGATNPDNADNGTIRKKFGTDISNNAVHGSDSLESAQREIALFFGKDDNS